MYQFVPTANIIILTKLEKTIELNCNMTLSDSRGTFFCLEIILIFTPFYSTLDD